MMSVKSKETVMQKMEDERRSLEEELTKVNKLTKELQAENEQIREEA